jgi:hypothetical protein
VDSPDLVCQVISVHDAQEIVPEFVVRVGLALPVPLVVLLKSPVSDVMSHAGSLHKTARRALGERGWIGAPIGVPSNIVRVLDRRVLDPVWVVLLLLRLEIPQ